MKPKTIAEIKANLETAAYVDRLLPPVRSPRYRCLMPEIIYTPQEIALMDRRPVRPRPTQAQVSLWETVTLEWIPLLEIDERRLVWKRANRIPWKILCREFGLCRSRLIIKYDKAIVKIEFYLKGKEKCRVQKMSGHFQKKSL